MCCFIKVNLSAVLLVHKRIINSTNIILYILILTYVVTRRGEKNIQNWVVERHPFKEIINPNCALIAPVA